MNKKNKILLLITIFLIFLSVKNVYAKDGWVTEKNNKYYYENNRKVTGFKNINNKTYFFSYYNSALKYGWQQLDGNIWYQNKYGEVVKSWHTISKKKYYFDDNGFLLKGFQKINGINYFFSNLTGELKYGWQGTDGNTWYQNQYGEVVTGWCTISKKKYFFDVNGFLLKGFQTIDGKYYFFSNITGELKYGWQGTDGNTWYQNQDGEVVKNWYIISNKKYYFDDNGFLLKGFQTIDENYYFFSNITGELKYGWQGTDGNTWYQNEEGIVYTTPGWATIDNKKYYFNDNGFILKGFQTIDENYYFFSNITGELKYGWQGTDGNTWYQNEEGIVYTTPGWATIDNKKYYFENNYAYKGLKTIDGKKYYFNDVTCEQITTSINNEYLKILIDPETTEFIKKQYKPAYYSQKNSRWGNYSYGFSNLAKTGCAPTSMAMAFSSILGREILPPEIAGYLYNYTDQYNKIYAGTSGLGIIYAAQKYGINYKGIESKEDLKNELEKGNIIFAAMADGKFATKKWNHAIVVFDYNIEYNTTYAYDPLTTDNNGWVSLDIIWNQKSNDPDDLLGGYALYSLY